LRAQVQATDAHVIHAMAPLRLDGVPDEPSWLTADSITDFTQREPAEGRPATERTVVRLLATPEGLWVGVWAYDALPAAIRHAALRRDSDFESDDASRSYLIRRAIIARASCSL